MGVELPDRNTNCCKSPGETQVAAGWTDGRTERVGPAAAGGGGTVAGRAGAGRSQAVETAPRCLPLPRPSPGLFRGCTLPGPPGHGSLSPSQAKTPSPSTIYGQTDPVCVGKGPSPPIRTRRSPRWRRPRAPRRENALAIPVRLKSPPPTACFPARRVSLNIVRAARCSPRPLHAGEGASVSAASAERGGPEGRGEGDLNGHGVASGCLAPRPTHRPCPKPGAHMLSGGPSRSPPL